MDNNTLVVGTYDTRYLPAILNNPAIEYIDTAVAYRSESIIPQDKKVISKIAPCMLEHYDEIIENHLRNLHRDSIDILMVHNAYGNVYELLRKMASDKRIKEIGLSNIPKKMFYRLCEDFPIRYAEYQINPYTPETLEMVDVCRYLGISMLAWGVLGGKYRAPKTCSSIGLHSAINYVRSLDVTPILNPLNSDQWRLMQDIMKKDPIHTDLNINANGSFNPMNYEVEPLVGKMNSGAWTLDLDHTVIEEAVTKPDFSNLKCLSQDDELIKSIKSGANWLTEAMVYLEIWLRKNHTDSSNFNLDSIATNSGVWHLNMVRANDTLTKVVSEAKNIYIYEA